MLKSMTREGPPWHTTPLNHTMSLELMTSYFSTLVKAAGKTFRLDPGQSGRPDLIGVDFFGHATHVLSPWRAGTWTEQISHLTQLGHLSLIGRAVSGVDLAHLKGLAKLSSTGDSRQAGRTPPVCLRSRCGSWIGKPTVGNRTAALKALLIAFARRPSGVVARRPRPGGIRVGNCAPTT